MKHLNTIVSCGTVNLLSIIIERSPEKLAVGLWPRFPKAFPI